MKTTTQPLCRSNQINYNQWFGRASTTLVSPLYLVYEKMATEECCHHDKCGVFSLHLLHLVLSLHCHVEQPKHCTEQGKYLLSILLVKLQRAMVDIPRNILNGFMKVMREKSRTEERAQLVWQQIRLLTILFLNLSIFWYSGTWNLQQGGKLEGFISLKICNNLDCERMKSSRLLSGANSVSALEFIFLSTIPDLLSRRALAERLQNIFFKSE